MFAGSGGAPKPPLAGIAGKAHRREKKKAPDLGAGACQKEKLRVKLLRVKHCSKLGLPSPGLSRERETRQEPLRALECFSLWYLYL